MLPADDPTAWQAAQQIAFMLGETGQMPVTRFEVAFGDDVPARLRAENHLIVIGRPSGMPIIGELSEAMPAPFAAGSDLADDEQMRVQYRLTADMSLGYLEQFPAPWDPSKVVLTVLGNDAAGMLAAADALLKPGSRRDLNGSLALINHGQIVDGAVVGVEDGGMATEATRFGHRH